MNFSSRMQWCMLGVDVSASADVTRLSKLYMLITAIDRHIESRSLKFQKTADLRLFLYAFSNCTFDLSVNMLLISYCTIINIAYNWLHARSQNSHLHSHQSLFKSLLFFIASNTFRGIKTHIHSLTLSHPSSIRCMMIGTELLAWWAWRDWRHACVTAMIRSLWGFDTITLTLGKYKHSLEPFVTGKPSHNKHSKFYNFTPQHCWILVSDWSKG